MFVDHSVSSELTLFAGALAKESRKILTSAAKHRRFESKGDESPVTEYDRTVELRLRQLIQESYPEHGILGEEFDEKDVDADFVWVLDPIDGTKAFIAGIPVFTTLIGLCHQRKPVLGVIDAPATGDVWIGVEGAETTRNGLLVNSNKKARLDTAVISFPNPDGVRKDLASGVQRLQTYGDFQLYGGSSVSFAQVASGGIDLTVEGGGLDFYDLCALVPVVEGAGGVCSDATGQPVVLSEIDTFVAAANPVIFAEAMLILNG